MLNSPTSAASVARAMYRTLLRQRTSVGKARNIVRGFLYNQGYGPHGVYSKANRTGSPV